MQQLRVDVIPRDIGRLRRQRPTVGVHQQAVTEETGELRALGERRNTLRQGVGRQLVVGIQEDDRIAMRRRQARVSSCRQTAIDLANHARAEAACDPRRVVRGSIVHHDQLAAQRTVRLLRVNAGNGLGQEMRLVVTRGSPRSRLHRAWRSWPGTLAACARPHRRRRTTAGWFECRASHGLGRTPGLRHVEVAANRPAGIDDEALGADEGVQRLAALGHDPARDVVAPGLQSEFLGRELDRATTPVQRQSWPRKRGGLLTEQHRLRRAYR